MRITTGWKHETIKAVELVDTMGDDDAICDAARVSFDRQASEFTPEQNGKLLKYLAAHDHWSPFAHVSLKFRFKAPMFIARQFQKHVVGFAWNEVSRRYVDYDPTFWIPNSFRRRPDNMKQGSVNEGETPISMNPECYVMDEIVNHYREAALGYKAMLNRGVCPEQARAFLPQGTMTEWIWTGSLQAWARFVSLRSDKTAQQECWEYASDVRYAMENCFPAATAALLGDTE